MAEPEIIGAYWKSELEKYLVSRKYFDASELIGYCSAFPTIENIKLAYGSVVDFVTQIPIPKDRTESVKNREKFLEQLDDIGLILFGDIKQEAVQKKIEEYNLTVGITRIGVKMVFVLQNLPELTKRLREILVEAGEFATATGLRITIPPTGKTGLDKLLEEEGFETLEF